MTPQLSGLSALIAETRHDFAADPEMMLWLDNEWFENVLHLLEAYTQGASQSRSARDIKVAAYRDRWQCFVHAPEAATKLP